MLHINSHWKHTGVVLWNRKHVLLLLDEVGYFCLNSFASGRCCRFAFSPHHWKLLLVYVKPHLNTAASLSRRQCLLAGTHAIIRMTFCSTSGKVGGDRVISAPLWQILPFLVALERWRYICCAFYYRPVSPPIFPFLILISASQAKTDVCSELAETPDITAFSTVVRKAKIYCILCV